MGHPSLIEGANLAVEDEWLIWVLGERASDRGVLLGTVEAAAAAELSLPVGDECENPHPIEFWLPEPPRRIGCSLDERRHHRPLLRGVEEGIGACPGGRRQAAILEVLDR